VAETEPQVLWTPRAGALTSTRVGRFIGWLDENRGVRVTGYDELWQWSVSELESFWSAAWEYFGIRAHTPYEQVLSGHELPGAKWFTGASLNYAEHALGPEEDRDQVAVIAHSQTRAPIVLTFGELRDQVARARAGLERLGVKRGDRVVWMNKDPFPHTATAHGTFDSGSIAPGHSWSYSARKPGEFAYVCTFHPGMKGTLIVQ